MGSSAWVLALALGLVAVHAVSATNYTLGGSAGWTNSGNINYTAELAADTIKVGDTVYFENNDNINHSVLIMPTQLSYDTCDSTMNVSGIILPPNYYLPITFKQTFEHLYFICGFHCLSGQKVTFSVVNASSTPAPGSAPTPSPTGYTAPPPSPILAPPPPITLTPTPASTPPASTPPAPTPASTSVSPPPPSTSSTPPTATTPPPPPASSNVTPPSPFGIVRSEAPVIARFGWLTIAVVCVLTCCNIL